MSAKKRISNLTLGCLLDADDAKSFVDLFMLVLVRSIDGNYFIYATSCTSCSTSEPRRLTRIEAHEFLLHAGVEGLYRDVVQTDLIDLGLPTPMAADWVYTITAKTSLEETPEPEPLTTELQLV